MVPFQMSRDERSPGKGGLLAESPCEQCPIHEESEEGEDTNV